MSKALIFSLFCTAIVCLLSLYVWFNLPELDRYPVHWNSQGVADGFADKKSVGLMLLILPGQMIFQTALFHFLPKIEPLRKNLLDSKKAYNTVWGLLSAFMTGVSALIAYAYMSENGAALGASPALVVSALSVLFIGIGNVLGKVRQNFMFGIRTPWTLSSELSWEKTHRLGARLFVAGGVVSLLAALLISSRAFAIFTVTILAITAYLIFYSFVVWKADPDKRS